jgi:hypothetical protein
MIAVGEQALHPVKNQFAAARLQRHFGKSLGNTPLTARARQVQDGV